MASLESMCTGSYSPSIVTMAQTGVISEIEPDIARKLRFFSYPLCQGYVPLTLDVMRVAFKVPLAFHTPL